MVAVSCASCRVIVGSVVWCELCSCLGHLVSSRLVSCRLALPGRFWFVSCRYRAVSCLEVVVVSCVFRRLSVSCGCRVVVVSYGCRCGCRSVSCRVLTCRVVSCRVVSCRVVFVSFRLLSYLVASFRLICSVLFCSGLAWSGRVMYHVCRVVA